MENQKHNRGGKRPGAGRKPKADEQKLIEKLSPLEPLALAALKKGIVENRSWALRMYFEYMYGKPKEQIELKTIKEQPLFLD